ncbi:LysM peptidoglycan-binding domain-containing protein [Ruegeria sp.]|uniref:LysM peptidoglycan-binding domain-containing protein n=1 Tax=Ruegeria sp. TaxID=1879320 RepID=UPI00230C30C8|nr:LysM peptidoglycan-binding domain-containing protein [Ruegeria sp.]MDA7963343.1 LysM peptidoglycan-binding domain-containing protein [Ruegeria sp.]
MDAKSGSGSFGRFIWGVIAGIVALVAAGALYLGGFFEAEEVAEAPTTELTPPEEVVTETVEVAEDAPQDTEQTEAVDIPAEAPTEDTAEEQTAEVQPAPEAPVLDQIFVERDGNTLLSGTAHPGADIAVLLDGVPVHEFTVDDTGEFAVFLTLPFADAARGLAMVMQGDQPIRSDDYLIAALPAPEPEDTPIEVAEAPESAEAEPEVPVSDVPATEETGPTEDEPAEPEVASVAPADATEQAPTDTTPTPAEDVSDVEPDQQVAILRSGEDGVELVQPPAAPSTPEQVALDTIGYSAEGEVQLTGRAAEGSAVRLYLDNQLVADLPAGDGTWRGELDGIDPGVYTLRVDEVDTDGTVVSRLETPFKREPVEVLQVAGADDETEETPPIRSVTVQKGDTLWAISRERFGDGILYVRLFDANRDAIRDPDLIYPGQIFTIPE